MSNTSGRRERCERSRRVYLISRNSLALVILSGALLTAQFSLADSPSRSNSRIGGKAANEDERTGPMAEQFHDPNGDFTFSGVKNILFLLDCSNSMKDMRKGSRRSKMLEAKELISQIVSNVPTTTLMGLRVFGEKYTGLPEIDCQDTPLLIPLGTRNSAKITRQLREIEPTGMSPLSLALKRTLEEDLEHADGRSVVILICDGTDTCFGDPIDYLQHIDSDKSNTTLVVASLSADQNSKSNSRLQNTVDRLHGRYYADTSLHSLIVDIQAIKSASGRK